MREIEKNKLLDRPTDYKSLAHEAFPKEQSIEFHKLRSPMDREAYLILEDMNGEWIMYP